MQLIVTKLTLDSGRLAAANQFGRYKLEVKQPVRDLDITESKAISQIKGIWPKVKVEGGWAFVDHYEEVFDLLEGIPCSARDVERFSISLAEFQDEEHFSGKAGIFLSAMINNSNDRDFIIQTNHITVNIRGIGYKNTKNITVEGNAGDDVGWSMSSGRILVKGDADEFVGWAMVNGKIVIQGYASSAGEHAIGGKIIVREGLSRVGESMGSGCEIYSNGEYSPSVRPDTSGKVFHKGRLIQPTPAT